MISTEQIDEAKENVYEFVDALFVDEANEPFLSDSDRNHINVTEPDSYKYRQVLGTSSAIFGGLISSLKRCSTTEEMRDAIVSKKASSIWNADNKKKEGSGIISAGVSLFNIALIERLENDLDLEPTPTPTLDQAYTYSAVKELIAEESKGK